MISIGPDGFLYTDLYTKPNTVNQLLSPRSAHPSFVTRSSVYSLALKLRRICSKEEWFERAVGELAQKPAVQGYSSAVVQAGIARARAVTRPEALKKVEKAEEEEDRQHRMIVEYDRRSCPALSAILKNNYEAAVAWDARFARTFPKVPKPVYRKGTNVKQLLCRAKLPQARTVNTRASIRENQRDVIRETKIHSSGETVRVEGKLNCKSKSFLYVLESSKTPKGPGSPPSQYVGQSGTTVATRLRAHIRSIEDQDEEKVVGKHFKETYSTREDLVFTPIMTVKVNNPWVRLHFERRFMNQHGGVDKFLNYNL